MSNSTQKDLNLVFALMVGVTLIAVMNFIWIEHQENLAWAAFEKQLQEPHDFYIAGHDRIVTFLSLRTYSLFALIIATIAAVPRNVRWLRFSAWMLTVVLIIYVLWAFRTYKSPGEPETMRYFLREATPADIVVLISASALFIYERTILHKNRLPKPKVA